MLRMFRIKPAIVLLGMIAFIFLGICYKELVYQELGVSSECEYRQEVRKQNQTFKQIETNDYIPLKQAKSIYQKAKRLRNFGLIKKMNKMTAVDNSGREYMIYINLDDYALSIKPKTQNVVIYPKIN